MSLLKSIGKVFKGVGKAILPAVASVIPGIGPVAGAVIGAGASSVLNRARTPTLPAIAGGGGLLPPIISAARTAAPFAAGAAGALMLTGDDQRRRRRRRKGISARDLSSFKRVARLVDKFSKPVHHFRNFKQKSSSI